MRKRNQFFIAVVASFALLVGGCAARVKTVTNLPSGVSSDEVRDWYGAVGVLDNISQVNHSLFVVMSGLHDSGVWTDEASYLVALKAAGRIDVVELSTANFLQTQPE